MRQIDDPEKVNVAFVQYEDFARAEAEVARLKDALRQANGVRDVFASAVVAQAMQEVDKMPDSRVPDDDMVICPGCVHQFRAIPVNVQARIAALEAERDALRQKLDGILKAYDAYRGRGMLPAPYQYALLVAAIDAAREKPCDCVRPEIHGHQLLCKHGKAR